jgi:hypothetical protein
MQHLDEGTIHAWLDGELPLEERSAVEAHLASCEECKAAVAEARGFIAASSRILTALDSVPGGVLPATSTGIGTAPPTVHRRFVVSRAWMAAAAVLVLSTVTVIAIRPGSDAAQLRVAAAERDEKKQESSAPPAEEKPLAAAPSVSNAPAPMQANAAPAADASKSVDQKERLKSRLEAPRQSPSPARAPQPVAGAGGVSAQPATPPEASALAKDAADKRADAASRYESMSAQGNAVRAQSATISGRVTSDAGAPLASASVVLQGANIGTITHGDGSYSLSVPASFAKGQTVSLVAKLIGYKAAVAPITLDSAPVAHDFVLNSNPLGLSEVTITGEGTTSPSEKLGAAAADSASAADATPRMLSRNTIDSDGDTVVTTIYTVGGVSVSLIDHSSARGDAPSPQVRGAVSEMPAKSRAAAAAVNSLTWSDSTGHTRTLRGPLSLSDLQKLKRELFGATP